MSRIAEIRDELRRLEHDDSGDVVDLDIAIVEQWSEWLDDAATRLAEATELLEAAWQQWSYETDKGDRWAGGLSTLEDIEAFLAQHQGGQDDER